MKLNKLLAVAVLSAATLLTACSKPAASSSAASSAAQASSAAASEAAASSEAAAKKTIKFGLGYQTAFAQSYGAWGLDNTIVAAAFDADGKILDARVDVTQYKFVIAANAEDATKYDVSLKPGQGEKSKLELGTDYNMLGSSAIGKEVYEQMEAWADWTVGKTVAQVEANEADIAGCSISTGAYVKALKDAFTKATTVETTATTFKVGVGMKDGGLYQGEASNYISGALTDGTNVIASYTDCLTFLPSATDATTVTLATASYGAVNKYAANATEGNAIMSKRDLGEKYGMKSKSPTGKEYNEQMVALDAYVAGKTLTAVAAIAADAEIAGVTITQDGLVAVAKEAVAYSVKDVITDKPVAAK